MQFVIWRQIYGLLQGNNNEKNLEGHQKLRMKVG